MDSIDLDSECIDLDGVEATSDDLLYDWDATVLKKLSSFALVDNENLLGDLMKEYIQSLKEITRSFENSEILKKKLACHLSFLYSYCIELQCWVSESYLHNMEEILTLYCNLELEIIRPLKKKNLSNYKYENRIHAVARRMIYMLTMYLFERHDHIMHVLIKMNNPIACNSCSNVLDLLYRHFLLNVPKLNRSDESFCRNYIVFQKWKQIKKSEDWERMDKILYSVFKRTPESVKSSETLRKILMPASQSTVDFVLNFLRPFRDMSNAYFKHLLEKNSVKLDLDFNIDLGDDEAGVLPPDDENDEEVKFMETFYEVERNMSNLSHTKLNDGEFDFCRKYKQELDDDDDDVLFVGRISPPLPHVPSVVIDEKDDEIDSMLPVVQAEQQRIPSPIPSLARAAKEKTTDVESLNGITRMHTSTPRPPSETAEVQTSTDEIRDSVTEIASKTNQSEVPTVSKPTTIIDSSDDGRRKPVEMKSVEVQADDPKNYVYNDYGLTTPPFEVQTDEHVSNRVYTNVVVTKSVEVQVDAPSHSDYDDFGLTPPNEVLSDDQAAGQPETCLYVGRSRDVLSEAQSREAMSEDGPAAKHLEDVEIHLSTEPPEDIDVESCHDAAEGPSAQIDDAIEIEANPVVETLTSVDQIDTGQSLILNTAPNIETRDTETFNGNTTKATLNRTNGQTIIRDGEPKIMYTSSEKIKCTPLDEFLRFESAVQKDWGKLSQNSDLDDVFTKPVTKVISTRGLDDNLFSSEPNAEENGSRSNSPTDMTSPAYEGIDDFRHYYTGSVKGHVGTSPETKTPQGILKKKKATQKRRVRFDKDTMDERLRTQRSKLDEEFDKLLATSLPNPQERVSFSRKFDCDGVHSNNRRLGDGDYSEDSCAEPGSSRTSSPWSSPAEESRSVRDSVGNGRVSPQRVLKRGIRVSKVDSKDEKLWNKSAVVVEKMSLIENALKRNRQANSTLRVDYDKSSNQLNTKDVVRYVTQPTPLLTFDLSARRNAGKVKSPVDAYCEKVSLKCAENASSCCEQLAHEFDKLNCNNVPETKVLNLTVDPPPADPETEFSNSPTFLPDTDKLVQQCLDETSADASSDALKQKASLLCDDSNFYKSQTINSSNDEKNEINFDSVLKESMQLPTAVPETFDFETTLKNEVFSKIDFQILDELDCEIKLPLKKRKLSVSSKKENVAVEEPKAEEISYPATPMISIAEVEALHPRKLQGGRPFKTPAERKEMPPLPVRYDVESEPSPIIADQFNINNHTYNNPTINYHMSNVPMPFINIPCGSYYSLPPILVPFNNVSSFDQSKLNPQPQETYMKKENRKQTRQRRRR